MTVDVVIPDEARHIVRAIRIGDDGSVSIHYASPVSIGGVMADGTTFLGGPYVGPFEIRVDHVLTIEANRRARRLGRLERAARELAAAPEPAPLPVARALPPVMGYRDPPRPAPAPLQPAVTDLPPVEEEDGTVIRGRMLELDLPRQLPAALCSSCGAANGEHERTCNRCPDCGSADQNTCGCP